jgi:hypothetical protein
MLTKELKLKLQEYQSSGLSETEIREKITKDFHEQLKYLKSNATESPSLVVETENFQPSKSTKNAPPSKTPKSGGISGKYSGGKGGSSALNSGSSKNNKAPTRRRSFDAQPAAAAAAAQPQPQQKAGDLLSQSLNTISTPTLPTASEPVEVDKSNARSPKAGAATAAATTEAVPPVDSWDSVTTQPFCTICQMAFKSESFLERHVKFSDLHITNAKKKKAVEDQRAAGLSLGLTSIAESSTTIEPQPPAPYDPVMAPSLTSPSGKGIAAVSKQVEGQHFKMLYTGSKFFWRTQESIDLHFYHHILPHCIEVVCYDNLKSKEISRLYLDYTCLLDIIIAASSPLLTDANKDDEEAQRTAITTYILQRLQLQSAISNVAGDTVSTAILAPAMTSSIMAFVKLTGDNYTRSPLLEKPPIVLIPVTITRRRRTNAEEIDATISNLTNDRAALVAATGQAEKIASLVYSSASSIASKKWWAKFNPVRRRWIWAIRRVIRQKLVKQTKQNLIDRAAKKKAGAV